ncbi:ComEC/Rec2 family competence protein [Phreatobacter sp.]|uniref:ComEC/Rec2 family competence protein n=1 Tax=Phreatobacter sp. TaxID=1966341 RepID=UPI003F72DF32
MAAGVRAATAGGWDGLSPLSDRLAALGGLCLRWLLTEVDRGRLFLGLPIAFAAGILLYFAAPDEPMLAAPVAMTAGLAIAAFRYRETQGLRVALVAAAMAGAGFSVATIKTALLAHPVLGAETATVRVTGWVEAVEQRESSDRVTLRVVRIEPAPAAALERVRVVSRGRTGMTVGQAYTVTARLRPPADPQGPGLYDFAREAYFSGIGASGLAFGRPALAEAGPKPWPIVAREALEDVRGSISRRIRAAIPGQSGAVADALVTGKRDGIPEALNEVMRAAGTYHILSISGFHMALVAALVFALVRGTLSLVPALALRRRVKAWAALVALAVSTAYLLISGAEVATQRSWIMVAVVLVGVALDRGALTLRTLAVAALIVLTVAPKSLLGPSFQMSFAATLALVSGYGGLRPWAERHAEVKGGAGRAMLVVTGGVVGLAMASLVASLATTPYAAHHFNLVHLYGVPGNLLGAPIVEFVVMPLEILALLLWPLGWDGPVWALAGKGVTAFIWTAEWVASWPGGKAVVPSFGPMALGIMSLGLILAAAPSTPLRWLGLPIFLAGMGLGTWRDPPPLVRIDADGTTVAARGPDGLLRAASSRTSRFTLQRWLASEADSRSAADQSLVDGVRCDALGCAMPLAGGGRIAVPRDPEAVADDCREASLVVTRHPAPADCRAIVVDLAGLPWTGAVVLRRHGDQLSVAPSRPPAGLRPWYRPRPAGEPKPLVRLPAARATIQPAVAPDLEVQPDTDPQTGETLPEAPQAGEDEPAQ